MYLAVEISPPAPAFVTARAKTAAEAVLANAGARIPDLALWLDQFKAPPKVLVAARDAAAASVAEHGHHATHVSLVIRNTHLSRKESAEC